MGADTKKDGVETFIARWQGQEGGQERANYALFLTELCDLIGVEHPEPAGATHERNDYVFERVVTRHKDDGDTLGRIDLYRKNSFVLEAKQSRIKGGTKEIKGQNDLFTADAPSDDTRGRRGADRAWDVLMLNAKRQAEEYARALPTSHGWPPFILVCDVGHCIEVYADFSGQGKNYTQFPDRQSFRIYIEDLRKAEVRERLHNIWKAPLTLDPAQASARVTRDIAKRLAQVSIALEKKDYPAQDVAMFLMRCLFTMFAEDVGLLPEKSFKVVLEECEKNPEAFVHDVGQLWEAMDLGAWAHVLKTKVKKFNGEFFKNRAALPLGREEIGELRQAATYNWNEVDPSIFGTLVEQALDKDERKRLGAHYTPRAYVERLVVATVIEPLREDWRNVQATAETLRAAGDLKGAAKEVQAFHDKLCETRVLDPACGTGNFLYVSLELMKRLEGEVLEALLDLGGQEALRGLGSHSVDPHQFLGLEINPRAAAIAELVLWIGYLQWHFRTKGGAPDEPILKAFKNIQVKNAVLTWDGEPVPKIVDGKETYPNARRPEWPAAEFIVGNPPFIGNKRMRDQLGSAYVDVLRKAWPSVSASVDFVMYWWQRSAELVASREVRRFGLVTTNSITMAFNRSVVERALMARDKLSIAYAVPDHPWVEGDDSADVRIAMTVGVPDNEDGVVRNVLAPRRGEPGYDQLGPPVYGKVTSMLRVGTALTDASPLLANSEMSYMGVIPVSLGFVVSEAVAAELHITPSVEGPLRKYLGGKDLADNRPNRLILDFFGLSADQLREQFPKPYQYVLEHVKPFRDKVNRKNHRERWWIFGEARPGMRLALTNLKRFIATTETSKHRWFTFLDCSLIPDQKIRVVADSDALLLGFLSAKQHVLWSNAIGGRVGKGNDPVYNNTTCFDPFPFPDANNIQKQTIRVIAEELDAHRKRVLEQHPHLTLTGLYNVLEELRKGTKPDALNEKDRTIFDDGLVLIMKELHDRLDVAVADAYGWPATLSDDEILAKLVALNKERAAEEKRGLVRWLRPDYQIPRFGKAADKQAASEEGAQVAAELLLPATVQKIAFPSGAVEQTAAVFAALAAAGEPLDAKSIAARFKTAKTTEKKVGDVLAALARLGHVTSVDGKTFALRRVA